MASPIYRQALHRKLIYAALILVLFTGAFFWRRGVEAQATELAIREQSRGDVDPIGAVVRLMTMGLRGVATCWEWRNAMEAQKRNQWNELEVHVRTLTKLQPHFITPWLFQSWNLSYNVSVESDRINDKYFWICRGINLLAEGERQNRDHPDMRWSIGFFTQHKIGQSDETNTLRSLSQLSMIPPNERDPGRFRRVGPSGPELDFKELEAFCKKHPQLARRLREGMRRERKLDQMRQFRCDTAEDFVRFLEDNYRVPSWWVDSQPSLPGAWREKQDRERPMAERFPVLPPKHDPRPKQQPADPSALTNESELRDEHDAYQVARAWYSYAQEPLPKPGQMPGQNEPIENRVYQRLPRMTTVIFRDYPAQAQRFTAERLQEEGWFDDSGWIIKGWFSKDRFPDNAPALVGTERAWGADAWRKTLALWTEFGEANHLLLDPAEELTKEEQARKFAAKYSLREGSPPPVLREDTLDAETRDQMFAFQFMRNYGSARHLTNFAFHYNRALVESQQDTLLARKTFFEANDALRLEDDEIGALKKFLAPTGMTAWRDKVLTSNKVFRRDGFIQEQTFEIQLRYLDLSARLGGQPFKAQAASMLLMPTSAPAGAGACPVALSMWLCPMFHEKRQLSFIQNPWDNPLLGGPFDRFDEEGEPFLSLQARQQVLQRLLPALYSPQPSPAEMMREGKMPPEARTGRVPGEGRRR